MQTEDKVLVPVTLFHVTLKFQFVTFKCFFLSFFTASGFCSLAYNLASEACKTTLKFLEKIPVYVIVIWLNFVVLGF